MFDFSSITNSWAYILEGVKYTIELTIITAVGGLILGTGLALCRLSTSKILSEFSKLYTNLMRAVPLVLVLFWFFLLMPEVLKVLLRLDHPVMIGAEMTAIITFVLFEAAYFAEIMRAGIQSVSKGQMSAAMALGLRYGQTMRYVILPQAMSTSVPAFVANVIFLLKETSVFSAISLMDLMFTAKDLIGLYYKTTESLFLLVVFYLLILLPVSLLGSLLERRLRYAGFGA